VAAQLLADGRSGLSQFSKVMPRDYKRVLQAIAAAEAEGVDPMSRVMGAV
jgi:glutamate synthase (NADPH/NADH) large chain